MLERKDLLSPGKRFILSEDGFHSMIDVDIMASFFERANLALVQAGITIPDQYPMNGKVHSFFDEGLDVRLNVDYSPRRKGEGTIPTGCELIICTPDVTSINQLTLTMFEFDEQYPFMDDPTAWGSYQTPESKYIVDYTPRNIYLDLLGKLIQERTEQGLFLPLAEFKRLLPLPQ